MKFKCSTCGAKLFHDKISDGYVLNEVSDDGTPEVELVNQSNGYDEVYCSKNNYHNIPDDVVAKVIDLA